MLNGEPDQCSPASGTPVVLPTTGVPIGIWIATSRGATRQGAPTGTGRLETLVVGSAVAAGVTQGPTNEAPCAM
jgi:hypothetical protein